MLVNPFEAMSALFLTAAVLVLAVVFVATSWAGRRDAAPDWHHYLGRTPLGPRPRGKSRRSREDAGAIASAPTVFKGADLLLEDGRVSFKALNHDATYGVEARALCYGVEREPGHMASCTCGFYSYADESRARAHDQLGPFSVLLTALASGDVLGYELGYRSSHQRVTSVALRECCMTGCTNPAAAFLHVHSVDATLQPVCRSCARTPLVEVDGSLRLVRTHFDYVTLERVSDLLSAQVPKRKRVEVLPGPGAVALTEDDLVRFHQPVLHAARTTKAAVRAAAGSPVAQGAFAFGRLGVAALRRGLSR